MKIPHGSGAKLSNRRKGGIIQQMGILVMCNPGMIFMKYEVFITNYVVEYEVFITNYVVEMTITWSFVLKLLDVHT